jgi:hypothetical protein
VQRYGQFCMCAEALWIQEIKPLFNSMKTLINVLEIAMYALELEIKFKKKIFPTYLPYFFHIVRGNTSFFFFLFGLIANLRR